MKINLLIYLGLILLTIGCSNDFNTEKIPEIDMRVGAKGTKERIENRKSKTLKVAVATMISPKESFKYYEQLFQYLGQIMGIKIIFEERKTYKEVNQMILHRKIDFALICSGAYIADYKSIPMEILAVPYVNGEPYYQAYIIVHKNSPYKSLSDLKGKTFAFTDPLSNTGYSYVIYRLKQMGFTSEEYFSKTIFTYAHDYSIQAVSRNIVEGASIDGLVYDYLEKSNPEVIEKIRVIEKSEKFGIPPIVTHKNTPPEIKNKIRTILFSMHQDSTGQKILKGLHIDKFGPGNHFLYKSLEEMMHIISNE